jgi:hypothetical protein
MTPRAAGETVRASIDRREGRIMGSPLNAKWHRQHVMPKNPSMAQRLRWHVAHARACGCRPMPQSVAAELRPVATQAGSPRLNDPA